MLKWLAEYFTAYRQVRKERNLRWWSEILVIAFVYGIYNIIRNAFGSGNVPYQDAFDNAELVIDIERFFGLYQELRIQSWFLEWEWFLRFWNVFYGSLHFAITTAVLVWLYVRFPKDFARWRTIGLLTTVLGLIGYALFPLMPPRLLPAGVAEMGAASTDSIHAFVDTVKEFGGLWSYNSGTFSRISNQYAAMPSLHFAWAGWCTMIMYPRMRRTFTKVLAAIYPVAVLFAIVVTANHYWLDAVGGLGALCIGYFAGGKLHDIWVDTRKKRKSLADTPETTPNATQRH